MNKEFNRGEHVFKSDAFEEIIKNTIRFFNGTPVVYVPPVRFHGTGVYSLYYIGKANHYKELVSKNRIEFSQPIYVGKAVPRGWRQARLQDDIMKKTYELHGRLREHGRSLEQVTNLSRSDFMCRFMILEGAESNLIGTVEAALIRYYSPIWNTLIDGFGNHDPGIGRYNQAKSDWDVLHPGRVWADRLTGESNTLGIIEERVAEFFKRDKK